jgi:hypothetical protein
MHEDVSGDVDTRNESTSNWYGNVNYISVNLEQLSGMAPQNNPK